MTELNDNVNTNENFNLFFPSDHPWSNFLNVRARTMIWMRDEMGYSNEEIQWHLSMDAMQVELIFRHIEENYGLEK